MQKRTFIKQNQVSALLCRDLWTLLLEMEYWAVILWGFILFRLILKWTSKAVLKKQLSHNQQSSQKKFGFLKVDQQDLSSSLYGKHWATRTVTVINTKVSLSKSDVE